MRFSTRSLALVAVAAALGADEPRRDPKEVTWPGMTKPGSVCDRIVSTVDFAETFLEAAGLPIPMDMQGHSLMPLLKGETPHHTHTEFG